MPRKRYAGTLPKRAQLPTIIPEPGRLIVSMGYVEKMDFDLSNWNSWKFQIGILFRFANVNFRKWTLNVVHTCSLFQHAGRRANNKRHSGGQVEEGTGVCRNGGDMHFESEKWNWNCCFDCCHLGDAFVFIVVVVWAENSQEIWIESEPTEKQNKKKNRPKKKKKNFNTNLCCGGIVEKISSTFKHAFCIRNTRMGAIRFIYNLKSNGCFVAPRCTVARLPAFHVHSYSTLLQCAEKYIFGKFSNETKLNNSFNWLGHGLVWPGQKLTRLCLVTIHGLFIWWFD